MSERYKEGIDWLNFSNAEELADSIAINRTASDLEIINVFALATDHSGYGDTNGIVKSAGLTDVVEAIRDAITEGKITEEELNEYRQSFNINEM